MAKRSCVGCGEPVTGASREHVLPQWLAKEIAIPEATLNHYLRNEDENKDELLRKHGLNNFAVRNVCRVCNNTWMNRLEDQAKPFILELMNDAERFRGFSPDAALALSRWSAKTAFMIASVQQGRVELPWHIFQNMRKSENHGPDGCFAFAGQILAMVEGFTYACLRDYLPPSEKNVVQLRVGFSIKRVHFVVVIPLVEGERIIRTDPRMHTALWPIDLKTVLRQVQAPATFASRARLQDFLTNLIEAGFVRRPQDGVAQQRPLTRSQDHAG
jgi:hypothetical protein